MELHVRRCLKDPKSFTPGAAILPSYFTSNLKGKKETSTIHIFIKTFFSNLICL